MRFSRTIYSVTRRGARDSLGEMRTPFFEYIPRVYMGTAGSARKATRGGRPQTCIVSKWTSAWMTKRFPSFGPPRPRCPSTARMLTILGGVTSECNVHLNRWFGDVLDLTKVCKWLVYGLVVRFLIVLASPLEGDGVCHQVRMLEIGTNPLS